MLAGNRGIRLSLAGVQDKLAVYVQDNTLSIPLENAPSSHILKPDFTTLEGVIFNEAFCLALARQIGLSTAFAEIKKCNDLHCLLIERYDRTTSNNAITRLHQEDFCQALGIASENKYQSEGGPSLKQCFELIRTVSSTPVIDISKLINAVLFNLLIGNCDAHGKKFSLLYREQLEMAPLYDLICTLVYETLDQRMAMKFGGEYKIARINNTHVDKLAEEASLSKPEMRRRLHELIDHILVTLPQMQIDYPIQETVSRMIKKRCESYLLLG